MVAAGLFKVQSGRLLIAAFLIWRDNYGENKVLIFHRFQSGGRRRPRPSVKQSGVFKSAAK